MNTILLILCNALSCFIISNILFQFMNGKYKRSSQNRYAYIVIEAVTVIFTTCINMLNHSICAPIRGRVNPLSKRQA